MAIDQIALALAKSLAGPLAKKLPDLLVGTKGERELAQCIGRSLAMTVDELRLDGDQRDELFPILEETFSRPTGEIEADRWVPSDGSLTLLIKSQVSDRISVLADPDLTGVGVSSLALVGVNPDQLAATIVSNLLNEIISLAVRTDSPLHLLAGILRDEAQHSELVASLTYIALRVEALVPTIDSDAVGVASVVDRDLVVPDGTSSAVIRLAITNISSEQQRLSRILVTVAESRPSQRVRLRLPGAPLEEYDLSVDLRNVASVDALAGAVHQFVLRPGESEAFRITATLTEGLKYKLVIHPVFESLVGRVVVAGREDQLTVDFPIQSIGGLRRAGRLP